jgi:hypothetical protein
VSDAELLYVEALVVVVGWQLVGSRAEAGAKLPAAWSLEWKHAE